MRFYLACLTLPLALSVAACSSEDPIDPVEPTASVDLQSALDMSDPQVIGVAIAPDTGVRLVFEENAGLYQLDADGTATLVQAMDELAQPGLSIRFPFTDVTALTNGQYAMTAIGDGFLLDTRYNTFEQHFCYEPGFFPEELEQRTDAVSYDIANDQIVAQPRTFDADGRVVASQIGFYDRTTGADLLWFDINTDFVAGGMTVVEGTVLLGSGTDLFRFSRDDASLTRIDDLRRYGIGSIDGLAWDAARARLVVVDNATDRLIDIDASELSF